jgi:hypothetical protein
MLAGLVWGGRRVADLERAELEHRSAWVSLRPTTVTGRPEPHREIGRAQFDAGETVVVEVCARDTLAAERWRDAGLELALWLPAAQKVVARRRLDDDGLRDVDRAGGGACLVLARGGGLVESGDYAVEAIWPGGDLPPDLARVELRAHFMAYRPARPAERWSIAVVLAGAVALVLSFGPGRRRRRRPRTDATGEWDEPDAGASRAAAGDRVDEAPTEDAADDAGPDDARRSSTPPAGRDAGRAAAAVAALLGATLAVGLVPVGGAAGALLRAALLAAVQLAVVFALVPAAGPGRGRAWNVLGVGPSRRGVAALGVAVASGATLWAVGRALMAWIPATGESAVGAVVAWPSGSLAVALASVASPLVEEVFFRGLVYGLLERRHGRLVAFVATTIIFAAAHLPQTWGAWGGFAAVAVTGAGLTALRAWSGTLAAPALAHLVHNGSITLLWVVVANG